MNRERFPSISVSNRFNWVRSALKDCENICWVSQRRTQSRGLKLSLLTSFPTVNEEHIHNNHEIAQLSTDWVVKKLKLPDVDANPTNSKLFSFQKDIRSGERFHLKFRFNSRYIPKHKFMSNNHRRSRSSDESKKKTVRQRLFSASFVKEITPERVFYQKMDGKVIWRGEKRNKKFA